jgi:streptomycin 6-kinase
MLREEWGAANLPDFELPGNLVRQLELHEPPGSALPAWVAELPSTVKQLARRWFLRPGRPSRIDPGLARARSELSRSLPATTGRSVLLCTDLHAGNVLAARREPWLVIAPVCCPAAPGGPGIDHPKPYLGDPAYDPLQHMLNCPDGLVADPAGFADRMTAAAGPRGEPVAVLALRPGVLASLDRPFLGGVAAALVP